jgi:sortase A
VYLPIRHGTSAEVLEEGVGHLDNTSLPVGGAATHAVLSGHTGLPTSQLLTDLDQLVAGDVFYVYVLGETLAYQVDQIKVVLPTETDDLAIVPGADCLTLVTCTPYGINSHRLLVRGSRIAYTETAEQIQQRLSARTEAMLIPGYVFAAIAGFLYVLGACIAWARKRG